MKKIQRLLKFVHFYITLLILLGLASTFFYFTNGLNMQNLLNKASVINPRGSTKSIPSSQFHGWVAWWDEASALDSIKRNSQKLVTISPVWYKIDAGGKLQQIPHNLEPQIKFLAQQSNIKLIPAISNDFDPKRVSKIVSNSDTARNLVEELANLAVREGYQGFDIDWEEIEPKDQALFAIFIQRLAEYLHTYNLVVAVSVHPQTGQSSDREVARGYDLAELGRSVDAVKIMAYDFHNKDSQPGAITPFKELKEVLDYTSSKIPLDKIILGLPTYGYDWAEGSGIAAEAVSFPEAIKRIEQNNGQTSRDKESGSLVSTYNLEGKKHTIWFEDAQTLNKMVELARLAGVYQFSFWRIGAEDPEFWTKIPPK